MGGAGRQTRVPRPPVRRPPVRGVEPVGTLDDLMKAFQRGLLVAAIAVAVSVVVRVRGKGRVPAHERRVARAAGSRLPVSRRRS